MGKTIKDSSYSRSENPWNANKYGRGWRKKADRVTHKQSRMRLNGTSHKDGYQVPKHESSDLCYTKHYWKSGLTYKSHSNQPTDESTELVERKQLERRGIVSQFRGWATKTLTH